MWKCKILYPSNSNFKATHLSTIIHIISVSILTKLLNLVTCLSLQFLLHTVNCIFHHHDSIMQGQSALSKHLKPLGLTENQRKSKGKPMKILMDPQMLHTEPCTAKLKAKEYYIHSKDRPPSGHIKLIRSHWSCVFSWWKSIGALELRLIKYLPHATKTALYELIQNNVVGK